MTEHKKGAKRERQNIQTEWKGGAQKHAATHYK